ncbi:MAG: arginine--tRNA ligase [Candidatus Aenigmarchaeota archaeon]|nr:arginine--tRNA ligase [Candidatus Aenigmarchaeota archaeon]
MNLTKKIKKEITLLLKGIDLLKDEKIEETFEKPPQPEFGDLASNISFSLSKKLKKSPQDIANEIVKKIKIPKDSLMSKVEAKAGYINFFFNYSKITRVVLRKILKEKDSYGSSDIGKKKRIMVEFAHPNTHKGFHIGHLRNISIGESISRILEFTGHKVFRTNYQGDIGPHVAKALWGFINLYKCKTPEENKGEWIGEVYAQVNKKFSDDERVNREVREINNKLYARDKEIVKLWKMTRKWSLDDFDKIYKELGTKFDKFYFESEVEKRAVEISKELLKRGVARLSEGAIIIDLSKYDLGIFLLLTSEGNPVYESKDLALAEREFGDFKIDRCIHVVGSEQKLYFQQLFKVFELIGSSGAGKSYHLVYELVTLKTGKMSSRLGTVVLYTQLRDKILKKVLKEVEKRNPRMSMKKKQELAKKIGIGALKYGMLSMSCDKLLVFDWKEALRLEGNTGPYLQYAHTRCNGILNKAKKWKINIKNENLVESEKNLVKKLAEFPDLVEKALIDFRPHYLCNYAYELATIFSEFYHVCPVLKAETEELRNFRLTLVKATKTTLKNCLNLLGIETPERM